MSLFIKIFMILTMTFFLHAGAGYSDTVILRNGEELNGSIQNDHFVVRGSYSQVVIKKSFTKNITMDSSRNLIGYVKTINNDTITGTILNNEIQFLLSDGTRETVTFKESFFYQTPNCLADILPSEPAHADCVHLIDVSAYRRDHHMSLVMDDEEGRAVAFLVPD